MNTPDTVDRTPRWLIALPCLTAFGYLFAERYMLDGGFGFPLDDSWIHLQFAKNLAAGDGLSYNTGELVTGSTAPLWTALLSLLFFLPGAVALWAKALGIATLVWTVLGVFRLSRELDLGRPLASVAGGVTALTSWLVWSALAAMEVGLFCGLSTWGIVLHLRERREPDRLPLSLAVLMLSILARPEGALLLLLALSDRCFRLEGGATGMRLRFGDLRRTLQGLSLGTLGVGPVFLFYWVVGGSPLPTTFSTKAGYGGRGLPAGKFLDSVQSILFQAQPVATFLVPAGILVMLGFLGSRRDKGWLLPAWVVGLPIAYGVLSSDRLLVGNFGRYFFILFPAVVVLAVVGWHQATRLLHPILRLGPIRIRWAFWVGILLLLPTLTALNRGAGLYTRSVLNVEDSDVRAARALASVLPAEAVLAVNDIGAVKFILPNQLLDLAGIVSPQVHQYAERAIQETGHHAPGLKRFVYDSKPDYLLIFPNWFPGIAESADFVPLFRLPIADNITMGGDELVFYGTPWTRYPLSGAPDF